MLYLFFVLFKLRFEDWKEIVVERGEEFLGREMSLWMENFF